ncbi:hypothetical protein CC78DRAFT_536891 [Lojkania enalia]|uniref:Integral membrane protein n=1 Tax=Lojkania enalia TaxID=147567 RepID=A0A9P4N2E3_9PLEO|nr:hypothetical protein CC78DRAFT_536891 [Didymosphaeria enalia]
MADRDDQHEQQPPQDDATTSFTTTTVTRGPHITTSTTSNNAQNTSSDPQTTVTSDGPQSTTTVAHPTVTTTHTHEALLPRPPAIPSALQPDRNPSIRIRRQSADQHTQKPARDSEHGRRRSSSEPQWSPFAPYLQQDDLQIRRQTSVTPLQTLHEEGSSGVQAPRFLSVPQANAAQKPPRPGLQRQTSAISIRPRTQGAPEYGQQVVDMLDVIDPEVATLTTLNNVQNSLFVPNFGSFYRRQPTYELSASPPDTTDEEEATTNDFLDAEQQQKEDVVQHEIKPGRLTRLDTISSTLTGMSEGHTYAVLPHGTSLPGWTPEDKALLNDHVRHLLHSRRAKFKRSMRGFGRYVRKPVGFLVTLYAFLLTFWGAAWVLFLIGWLSVKGRQAYFIEICDQILTALFCVVGIGFAPWRAIDTYHMIYVARYAHLTWQLRKKRGLPKLKDHNELPARPLTHPWETNDEPQDDEEIVITPAQQEKLEHHQSKLAASHTFYKPHETRTHRAFSVRLLITIIVLLDCHSLFQMALGATTWGIYYKVRPKALTAVILTCSICCNISAGVTISVGDRRSRKKMVVEEMFRQELTGEALRKLRKRTGLRVEGAEGVEEKEV